MDLPQAFKSELGENEKHLKLGGVNSMNQHGIPELAWLPGDFFVH